MKKNLNEIVKEIEDYCYYINENDLCNVDVRFDFNNEGITMPIFNEGDMILVDMVKYYGEDNIRKYYDKMIEDIKVRKLNIA